MAVLIDSGEIKQVIIITDVRSDSRTSTIEAARKAYDAGIIVSAIGIVNLRSNNEKDIQEVKEIAMAGGGLWEYSHIEDLSRAIQDLTSKTSRRTIEQIVGRQLKAVIGEEIEDLEPKSKIKIIDFIENYGENINLKCIIVFDIGESMRDRLAIMKKSVTELFESLNRRKGRSSIAVISCPEGNAGMYSTVCDFTSDIYILKQKLEMMCLIEDTSEGSPILKACELMHRYYEVYDYDISR